MNSIRLRQTRWRTDVSVNNRAAIISFHFASLTCIPTDLQHSGPCSLTLSSILPPRFTRPAESRVSAWCGFTQFCQFGFWVHVFADMSWLLPLHQPGWSRAATCLLYTHIPARNSKAIFFSFLGSYFEFASEKNIKYCAKTTLSHKATAQQTTESRLKKVTNSEEHSVSFFTLNRNLCRPFRSVCLFSHKNLDILFI